MVTGIDYDADAALFTVHHDKGDTLASSVIACMGATPPIAGFVGEDTYRGRGVSYCATCDGMFFRSKQVFVIGGGNAACEEALFLSKSPTAYTSFCAAVSFVRLMVSFRKVLAKGQYYRLGTKLVLWSYRAKSCQRRVTFKDNASGETHTESVEPGSFGIFVFTGTQPIPSLLSI